MIRFLLRALGLFGLAAAFVLVIYDGTKSIAGNRLFLTSVGDLWTLLNANSLSAVRPLVSPYANGVLWDPVAVTFLSWRPGRCSALSPSCSCCLAGRGGR